MVVVVHIPVFLLTHKPQTTNQTFLASLRAKEFVQCRQIIVNFHSKQIQSSLDKVRLCMGFGKGEFPQRPQNDENTQATFPKTDINQSSRITFNTYTHTHTKLIQTHSHARQTKDFSETEFGMTTAFAVCLQITAKLLRLLVRLPHQLAFPTQHYKI